MTARRQARAILPLPGVVTVLVPVLIFLTTGTDVGWGLGGAAAVLPVLLGIALLAVGSDSGSGPCLEKRFGDEYRAYKRNVPRWLPRRTPWTVTSRGAS